MDKVKNYDIIFSGLKNGIHEFEFEIKEAFFTLFDTDQEFEKPDLKVIVKLEKHSTFMELWVNIYGKVELTCDISNENFDYEIKNESKYLVKFGEEFDYSHEEILIIPRDSYYFNIAQIIYENIALSIPMKKLSPNLSDEDLAIIDKYSPKEKDEVEEEELGDPRWEALRKLKK